MEIVLKSVFLVFLSAACLSTSQGQIFAENGSGVGVVFNHDIGDIEDNEWGTGAVWLDFDGDQDLDLYLTTRVGSNRFFENVETSGVHSFVDITASLDAHPSCLGCISTGIIDDCAGVSAADWDNDGDPDLYISTAREDIFLVNEGETHFSDQSAAVLGTGASHLTRNSSANSISWGDFDNDGFLDLYLSCHTPADYLTNTMPGDTNDFLLHNHQGQYFEDASYLIDDFDMRWGSSFITAWTDFDNDDDLDLIVTNDCTFAWPVPMVAYRNEGGSDWTSWQFDTVTSDIGINECNNAMGIAVGDINRDGLFDFAHSDIGHMNLWRNNGGTFSDIASSAGVAVQELGHYSWGVHLADFDNDSWLDITLIQGYYTDGSQGNNDLDQPNFYFHNNGGDGETFTDLSASSGFDEETRGRTSAIADYNLDGDLDMIIINYDNTSHFKENVVGNSYNWIQIDLEGTVSNREGVGAKVTLHCRDQAGIPFIQYAESRSGSSLGAGDSPYLHFGLGPEGEVDSVVLDWPSGIHQSVIDPEINSLVDIIEADPLLSLPSAPSLKACMEGGDLLLSALFNTTDEIDSLSWAGIIEEQGSLRSVLLRQTVLEVGTSSSQIRIENLDPNIFDGYQCTLYSGGEIVHQSVISLCEMVSAFEIYPNPARDYLYFADPANVDIESVFLVNTSGQKVLGADLWTGAALDLSSLLPGVYVVCYNINGALQRHRVMKL